MVNIIIPMAGEGKRFVQAGYTTSKPLIPVVDRRDGKEIPMVIAAVKDLPGAQDMNNNIVFILRDVHRQSALEEAIRQEFVNSHFIYLPAVTAGQAVTCLAANAFLNKEEIIIGACDNGQIYDARQFERIKQSADAIIFTYRHDQRVLENPYAYGWVEVAADGETARRISVKQPISANVINDHAIVATFWFKQGADFARVTAAMIQADARVNNEFYVDLAMDFAINMGLTVKVFEINRYLGWGTPLEYENYMKTWHYWREYCQSEDN